MPIQYLEWTEKDLSCYLIQKWINSSNYIEKLWNREENEDMWEIIWTFISSYIINIIENKEIEKVFSSNQNLEDEITEFIDWNDLINKKSWNIIYIDFKIKSEEVIDTIKKEWNKILNIFSVFDLEEKDKSYIDSKNIKYNVILK